MKDVGIGMRDGCGPCLWFTSYISEGGAALQILSWEEANKVIKDTGVYDVKNLEGRACIVDVSKVGLIQFVRVTNL